MELAVCVQCRPGDRHFAFAHVAHSTLMPFLVLCYEIQWVLLPPVSLFSLPRR